MELVQGQQEHLDLPSSSVPTLVHQGAGVRYPGRMGRRVEWSRVISGRGSGTETGDSLPYLPVAGVSELPSRSGPRGIERRPYSRVKSDQ